MGEPPLPTGPAATVRYLNRPNDYDRAASRVIFYVADGRVSGVATLDDNGEAQGYVNQGGAITLIVYHPAADNRPANTELMTITAMEEAETVELGYNFGTSSYRAVTVDAPPYEGAAKYRVTSYCNRGTSGSPFSTSSTGLQTMVNGCNQADFHVEAFNAMDQRIATLFADDISVPSEVGATVTVTGAYRPLYQHAYAISNLPATVQSIGITAMPHPMAGQFVSELVPMNGVLNYEFELARVNVEGGHTSYRLKFSPNSTMYIRQNETFQEPATVDASSLMMPIVTAPTLSSDLREIAWAETSGADALTMMAGFSFDGTARGIKGSWKIMGPRDTTRKLRWPALPADFQQLGPAAADNKSVPWVSLEHATNGITYADYRKDAFAHGTRAYHAASKTRSTSFYP